MPTVYVTSPGNPRAKFHRDEDCPQLRKRLRGSRPPQVRPVDLDEVRRPQACRTCYTDSPRAVSAHRYCTICDPGHTRPCAHNGGVQVLMTRTRRRPMLFSDEGETYARVDWVWPEQARHYPKSN